MTKIGVITASKGLNEDYLKVCAESVYTACKNVEFAHIVVVPVERQSLVQNRLPRSLVIVEGGKGLYPALNQGFEYACREAGVTALSYINDDDGLIADGFDLLLKRFAREGGRSIVYGRVQYTDAFGRLLGEASICRHPADLLGLFAEGIPGLTQQGTVFPAECFETRGGFSGALRLAADSEWIVRLLAGRERFVFVNAKVAFYRCHMGQLSDDVASMEDEGRQVRAQAARVAMNRLRRKAGKLRFRLSNIGNVLNRMRWSGIHSTRMMFSKKIVIR
jgi:hypothetical protein